MNDNKEMRINKRRSDNVNKTPKISLNKEFMLLESLSGMALETALKSGGKRGEANKIK